MIKNDTLSLINKDEMNFKNLFSICIGNQYLHQRRFIDYIGKYSHLDVDLTMGILLLDEKKFNIECIGSTSKYDSYWCSSEIEKVIPDEYVNLMIKTRQILEKINILNFLTDSKIVVEGDINGYNLSMIYIAFCPEEVAYFCANEPASGSSVYMFVKNLPKNIFRPIESYELFGVINEIISTFNVDSKLMVKALLMESDIAFEEENDKIIAIFPERSKIEFEFEGNNFSGMHGVL